MLSTRWISWISARCSIGLVVYPVMPIDSRRSLIAGHRVSGQRNDGNIAPGCIGRANMPDGFRAIHDRHMDVEQHKIKLLFGKTVEGFPAVRRFGDDNAAGREQQARDAAVYGVVIHQQDLQPLQCSIGTAFLLPGREPALPTSRRTPGT